MEPATILQNRQSVIAVHINRAPCVAQTRAGVVVQFESGWGIENQGHYQHSSLDQSNYHDHPKLHHYRAGNQSSRTRYIPASVRVSRMTFWARFLSSSA